MTRKKQLDWLCRLRVFLFSVGMPMEWRANFNQALSEAIKALDQEPILDKIRAEIDGLTYYWCEVNPGSVIDDVLEIIDKYKYKAESEDKE